MVSCMYYEMNLRKKGESERRSPHKVATSLLTPLIRDRSPNLIPSPMHVPHVHREKTRTFQRCPVLHIRNELIILRSSYIRSAFFAF